MKPHEDPWQRNLAKEQEEQNLINAGGSHPAPWESKWNTKNGCWTVVDSNGHTILGHCSKPVSKWIADTFNRAPVIFLEDDIVY
jgi:hypothetical protein